MAAILHNPVAVGIITAAAVIAEAIFGIGATLISLNLAKGVPTSYADIVPPMNIFWRYLFANLLCGALIICGFFVPMIPAFIIGVALPDSLVGTVIGGFFIAAGVIIGVYTVLRYSMVKYAAVDGKHKVFDILRLSAKISRGTKWRILLFLLAVILLNIAGAIVLLIGLLVTIPITAIATGHIYLKLLQKADIAAPVAATPAN